MERNLVPVEDIDERLHLLASSTQTVGNELRVCLRDRGAIVGGQGPMPLGYAIQGTMASPHDGVEVQRRLFRWVAELHAGLRVIPGPWKHEGEITPLESRLLIGSACAPSAMSAPRAL
jgi:hypothetical protein